MNRKTNAHLHRNLVFCSSTKVPPIIGLREKTYKQRALRPHLLHLSLVLSILVLSAFSQAQNSGAKSAPRDATAKVTLQAAILALGGDQLQALKNCVAHGQVSRGKSVGTFKWENSGADFHYEETVGSTTSMVVSNHGTPTNVIGKQVTYFPPHFLATLFPRPLIGLTLNHYYSDVTVGLAMASGTATTGAGSFRVEVTFPQDQNTLTRRVQQEWTIDAKTGLPTQVHQWAPGHPIANFIRQSDTYFSNYKVMSGVPVPSHIDEYSGKTLISSYDVASVQCGASIDPSDFTVQGGGQ